MSKKTDVEEMVAELLQCERFTKQDFANKWQYHPGTFGDLLTKALDIVRLEHGIEFRPGPHGSMHRANYKETLNRSIRQRLAGLKKLERSAVRAQVSANMAPVEERAAIEKTANRQRMQLVAAKVRDRKRLTP